MALERVPADIRADGGVARMVSCVLMSGQGLGRLTIIGHCIIERS
jgi:pyridoxal biosynthesis lyase PdxS